MEAQQTQHSLYNGGGRKRREDEGGRGCLKESERKSQSPLFTLTLEEFVYERTYTHSPVMLQIVQKKKKKNKKKDKKKPHPSLCLPP